MLRASLLFCLDKHDTDKHDTDLIVLIKIMSRGWLLLLHETL